jgi:hypothetical protein
MLLTLILRQSQFCLRMTCFSYVVLFFGVVRTGDRLLPVLRSRNLKELTMLAFAPCKHALTFTLVQSALPQDAPDLVLTTDAFNLGKPVSNRIPSFDYKVGTTNYRHVAHHLFRSLAGTFPMAWR